MPGIFQVVIQGTGELAVYNTFEFLGSLNQDVLIKRQQKVFEAGPVREILMKSIVKLQEQVKPKVGESMYAERGHWNESLEADWISVLCRILIGIQKYRHGGAVLISDSASGLNPKYVLPYNRLSDSLFRAATLSIQNTTYSGEIHGAYMEELRDDLPMGLYLDELRRNSQQERLV